MWRFYFLYVFILFSIFSSDSFSDSYNKRNKREFYWENIKNFFRFFKDTQFLKEKMKKQNKKTQTKDGAERKVFFLKAGFLEKRLHENIAPPTKED